MSTEKKRRHYDNRDVDDDTQRKGIVVPPKEWSATNKTEDVISQEIDDFMENLPQEERNKRFLGKFWSAMETVWDKHDCCIEENDFKSIVRSEAQGVCYSDCYINLGNAIRSETNRSGSVHDADNNIQLDAFGNLLCEKAHLLPHARTCCKAFGFMAEAVVGMVCNDKQMRQKILRGVKNVNNSSLTEHKYNTMYLRLQGKLYDGEKTSILIVPILSLKEVMDWAGGDRSKPRESYDVMAITFGDGRRSQLTSKALLTYSKAECTIKEIDTARTLLVTFVKGIAASLLKNDIFESFDDREIQSISSLNVWKQRVDILRNPSTSQGRKIQIPVGKDFTQDGNPRVAKGRMSLGNSLPDPWLLTMKAAINYSFFCKRKLMPACPHSDSDSDDGPMNINYGDEFDDSSIVVDHAADLFLSLQSGGKSIELYSDDDKY